MDLIFKKLDQLKQAPRWFVLCVALLIVVLIGLLDYIVGEDMDLSILYVPVIAAVCWRVGLTAAVIFSVLCSLLWLLDNLITPNVPLPTGTHYWESLMRFISFLFLVVLLSHLQKALDREAAFARGDSLTGLANVKLFVEQAEHEIAVSRRDRTPITVVFLDCDHFKQVNDKLGHPQGDTLLKQVADAIRACVRKSDVAARMGGDEFALLCPRTDATEAERLGSRLKASLDDKMHAEDWPVTFSIGVVTFVIAPETVADLIRESDNLMYAVKHTTKDGVRYATIDESLNPV